MTGSSYNPYENAQSQFDRVAEIIGLMSQPVKMRGWV